MSHRCGMMRSMKRVDEIINIGMSMTGILRLLVPRRRGFRRHDRETVSGLLEAVYASVDADRVAHAMVRRSRSSMWGIDGELHEELARRGVLGEPSQEFRLLHPQAMRCGL